MEKLVCFAHGKESGPWGSKIQRLAEVARTCGWAVDSPDYSHTQDPDARVDHLLQLAPRADRLVLVGSSMGGYVSAMACEALAPQGLFLMAPALYFPGYDGEPTGTPEASVVAHGWEDDIVPVESAIRFARERHAELHLVRDGHRLIESLDLLAYLLGALLDRVAASAHSRTNAGPR